uniref:Uncharacterized protein n=1 Tax=mine drainage metagenome TaxID=410659 RepID=E6QRD5_9ZZZZ
MITDRTVSGRSALFAARLFNIASIIATVIAPLLMLWIAASIFAYASIAHHPNPRTVYYNRISGYRFYGVAGAMVVAGQPIYGLFGNWHGLVAIWVVMMLVVVPAGLWDIYRAGRENWQDITLETETESE